MELAGCWVSSYAESNTSAVFVERFKDLLRVVRIALESEVRVHLY